MHGRLNGLNVRANLGVLEVPEQSFCRCAGVQGSTSPQPIRAALHIWCGDLLNVQDFIPITDSQVDRLLRSLGQPSQ